MIRSKFNTQVEQLLHSIGDVEGMITPDEAEDLRDKIHELLSPGKPRVHDDATPRRTFLHLHAAAALRKFIRFVTEHEHDLGNALNKAVKMVADHLTEYYAVTSKEEKDLLEELRRKARSLHDHHRRAG
jgi:ElaB/YqjD/DUF883 family membrane-anchored ribosome-binding protein